MENIVRKKEKDNKGFSVISVLIAMAFIGTLAMIVLYVSAANFQMKVTGLKSKDNFYTAEKALDEIRVGLQSEVGKAMSKAYISVMEEYGELNKSTNTGEALDALRKNSFNIRFVEELMNLLKLKDASKVDAEALNDYNYDLEKINGFIDSRPSNGHLAATVKTNKAPVMEGYIPPLNEKVPTEEDEGKKEAPAGVLLKNLRVIYEDDKGLASIIETDINLHIPEVTFPEPSTVPDLMNMILVANKGIVCENSNIISGSFYAGYEEQIDPVSGDKIYTPSIQVQGGGLKITGGEYAVCSGDIEVGNGSNFENYASELWANNINITSATVKLTGSTYIADDMTINTLPGQTSQGGAGGSDVTISGNYSGFGTRKVKDELKEEIKDYLDVRFINVDKKSNTALESSIIINGKGTVLDMSGLKRLLVAGTSYVPMDLSSKDVDVLMGESIAVKGNQLAYLLPSEYLYDSAKKYTNLTNPLPSNIYQKLNNDPYTYDTPAESLGGLTLANLMSDYGVTGVTRQLRKETGTDNAMAYYYLCFEESEKAAEFFKTFYDDFQKENMDKYLSFYLNREEGIKINPENLTRFYTKGNIMQYDKTNGGSIEAPSSPSEASKDTVSNMKKWFALTRKMIDNYALLKIDLEKERNERDPDKHVFENLIDEEALETYLGPQTTRRGEVSDEGETIVTKDVNYNVSEAVAKDTRLIVATGDVTVEANVKFQGIIMAGGTITLKSNATMNSAPRSASRVFQAQSDEFKKIFWEGDAYIQANSSSGGDDTDTEIEKDTYDLAESVTYENWSKK